MFITPNRCPVCYSQWQGHEVCTACGCMPEIFFERDLPHRNKINSSRIEKVINAARMKLADQANEALARYALGLSYAHFGLLSEGAKELRWVAESLPEKYQIRYESVVLSVWHSGGTKDDMKQLDMVLKMHPNFKQALYLRGILFENLGDFSGAIKNWQVAYKIDSSYQPALGKLQNFIARESPNLPFGELNLSGIDPLLQQQVEILRLPRPLHPPELGKTSLEILRKLSTEMALRMENMYSVEVRKYENLLQEREKALKNLSADVLTLSNLCLENANTRKPVQALLSRSVKPLAIQERTIILNRAIQNYQKNGYRLISQTETTAQLYKPKEFNGCLAIILVFLIIGIILWLILYLTEKDETLFIEVDEYGQVHIT